MIRQLNTPKRHSEQPSLGCAVAYWVKSASSLGWLIAISSLN